MIIHFSDCVHPPACAANGRRLELRTEFFLCKWCWPNKCANQWFFPKLDTSHFLGTNSTCSCRWAMACFFESWWEGTVDCIFFLVWTITPNPKRVFYSIGPTWKLPSLGSAICKNHVLQGTNLHVTTKQRYIGFRFYWKSLPYIGRFSEFF